MGTRRVGTGSGEAGGWDEEQTVQVEGVADEPEGVELQGGRLRPRT